MTVRKFSLDSLADFGLPSETSDASPRVSFSDATSGWCSDDIVPTIKQASASEIGAACLFAGLSVDQEGTDGPLTVADVLLRAGVYPVDRAKRDELAMSLLMEGIGADDVRLVAHRILSNSRNANAAIGQLVNLLRDLPRLRAAIEDVRKLTRVEAGAVKRWHPGERDRIQTAAKLRDERRAWAEADREHYIRCRVRDGIPEAVAAAEWLARQR